MTTSDFNDEPRVLTATGWEETSQSITVPELPFALNVVIGDGPAIVYLAESHGSSESAFLKLNSTSTVHFNQEGGIEVAGQHRHILGLQPGRVIIVRPVGVGIHTLKTCKHGFAPPESCQACRPSMIAGSFSNDAP